jgi:hypothetical protein
MVAFTLASSAVDGYSRLHAYDRMGRELWTKWERKIRAVSRAYDGRYSAIGSMDFAIALFAKNGELLWETSSAASG